MRYLMMCARVSAVGALMLAGGCGCELVGCVNGLLVVLTPQPTSAYRVEVRPGGSQSMNVIDCPDPSACGGQAFFLDFFPADALVSVTTARGTVTQNVRPSYTTSRPNGGRCDPVCRHGRVTVALPQ